MARYIDAEKEIKEIEAVLDEKRAKGDDEDNIGFYALMLFARKLHKAPTEDVEPVIRAHWKPIKKKIFSYISNAEETITVGFTCSNCGTIEEFDWERCRCGAKMDNGTYAFVWRNSEKENKDAEIH